MSQAELLWGGVNLVILMGTLVTAWTVLTGKAQKRDLGPQPFSVAMEKEPLTVTAHKEICGPLHHRVGCLENDVRMIRHKMEADKVEIIQSGEDRVKELHRRLDGLPHQVIALLKDTKGLIS